jgi:hypothetical protein
MLTRRRFLLSALAVSATASTTLRSLAQPARQVTLRLASGPPTAQVPLDFTGLGYEMLSVAQPGLLNAQNALYVQLVRNLGQKGIFRFGGIVADYTRYLPDEPSRTDPKDTVINQANLEQLRGFLDATDWSAIWSVNFGRGTLPEALAEARAVSLALGPRLYALELGNEVENYGRGNSPARQAPWDFPRYLAEYRQWHAAILAAVPGVRMAAPDTAASVDWVREMAEQAHAEAQLLTTHFYLGDQRKATLAQMIEPSADLSTRLSRLREISKNSGLPWRMCETNSFFGGGHPGLSDTFAGALWTLNFMLLLAQSGCAGVNLETGVNQLGFLSSYSPIRTDAAGRVTVGVPYYGMLAFAAARAAGAGVLPVEIAGAASTVTAYAVGRQDRVQSLVILNWSETDPVLVSLAGLPLHRPRVLRLTAPSLSSHDAVQFGNADLDASGRWSPKTTELLHASQLTLPPATAAVLQASTT